MIEKFTSKDIVSIISACSKNGVREFSLGDLKMSLGDPESESDITTPQPQTYDLEKFVEAEEKVSDFATEIERMTLLAEDPLAYEQLMEYEANEENENRGAKQVLPRGRQLAHESHGGDQKQYFA